MFWPGLVLVIPTPTCEDTRVEKLLESAIPSAVLGWGSRTRNVSRLLHESVSQETSFSILLLANSALNEAFKSMDHELFRIRGHYRGLIKETNWEDIIWRHPTPISYKWLNSNYWLKTRFLWAELPVAKLLGVMQIPAFLGCLLWKAMWAMALLPLLSFKNVHLFSETGNSLKRIHSWYVWLFICQPYLHSDLKNYFWCWGLNLGSKAYNNVLYQSLCPAS